MDVKYEEYKMLLEEQRERNDAFLEIFVEKLLEASLTEKTIKKHSS